MRSQKVIIITVVSTILLLAIIGISMLLNNQTKAAGCSHPSWTLAWDENYHWNKCTKCSEPVFGLEPHTFVNGECIGCSYKCNHQVYLDGKCTKCGMSRTTECSHPSWTLAWDENYHWNKCTTCSEPVFGLEPHTFVNGECIGCSYKCNHQVYLDGKCTKCGMSRTTECSHPSWTLAWDAEYHWNKCTSCGEVLFGKEAHKYTNGVCTECNYKCTHQTYINGKCAKCGMSQTETCSHPSWTLVWDADYHWNECTSCGEVLFGKEAHKYTNGVCVECSYKCTHRALEWKHNETEHWQVCKECAGVLTSSKKAHTVTVWKDAQNGTHTGTCTVCNRNIQENHSYVNDKCKCGAVKVCTHDKKQWKSNENEHWQVCTNCNKEISGTRVSHTYKNGICTTCSYNCKHSSKIWKKDETSHWQECKICLMEIAGTRASHSINTWEKVDDNTHRGTCTVCNKIIQENHKYENGKCKCGLEEKKENPECKHSETKWLAISTEHWKVCKSCGEEISGTRANHTFENGKCKECNYQCKHEKVIWKNNETEHWKICENCLMEMQGTRASHTFENGICKECLKAQTQDNNNNKPTDPDNTNNNNKPTDPDNTNNNNNEPTNPDNTNNNNNEPTNPDNTNNNNNKPSDTNKDETNNKKDDTTSQKDIPNTGKESMQIAVMITLAIIGGAVLIRLSGEED